MLKDITLGQYYQCESAIHKLDPRSKLICIFVYIISLFLFKTPYIYILAILFLTLIISTSRVPLRFILRGMKPIVFLLIFTVVLNMFLTPGEAFINVWKLTITKEGFQNAILMGLRLILLIIGSSVLTLTTTPSQLTDGLESIFKPLKIVKVPVHEMAMMMSIALRFIPILVEETDKIMKAQLARCADFESGNIIKRMKSLVPVLIPLFVSAFRRANDLALAMEARCYCGGAGRTKMKPLKYKMSDFVAYTVSIIYLAGIILFGVYSEFLPYGTSFFVK